MWELQTERLILREMTETDLPALCAIIQDPLTMYAYEGTAQAVRPKDKPLPADSTYHQHRRSHATGLGQQREHHGMPFVLRAKRHSGHLLPFHVMHA